MAKSKSTNQWPVKALAPPNLSMQEWNMTMLLGVVFIATAILQLISFSDFKDALGALGIPSPATWGAVIVLAELWASANFFKLPLSMLFRMFSSILALTVSGFWFFETLRLVAASSSATVTNTGFFGRFLSQSPGWWTVIETTIVLFWTFWAVNLTQVKSK